LETSLNDAISLIAEAEKAATFLQKLRDGVVQPYADSIAHGLAIVEGLAAKSKDQGPEIRNLGSISLAFGALRAACDLGKSLIPFQARRSIVLAVLAGLAVTYRLNRQDVSIVKEISRAQLEAGKQRKIDIYDRISDEDRAFLREYKKIKDIDYDELEDRLAAQDAAAAARGSDATSPEDDKNIRKAGVEVEEEDNYFMTSAGPGRDEEGQGEYEADYA
jgi:hypothetical protein